MCLGDGTCATGTDARLQEPTTGHKPASCGTPPPDSADGGPECGSRETCRSGSGTESELGDVYETAGTRASAAREYAPQCQTYGFACALTDNSALPSVAVPWSTRTHACMLATGLLGLAVRSSAARSHRL